MSRAMLLARLGDSVSTADAAQFAGMVARRAQREPSPISSDTKNFTAWILL